MKSPFSTMPLAAVALLLLSVMCSVASATDDVYQCTRQDITELSVEGTFSRAVDVQGCSYGGTLFLQALDAAADAQLQVIIRNTRFDTKMQLDLRLLPDDFRGSLTITLSDVVSHVASTTLQSVYILASQGGLRNASFVRIVADGIETGGVITFRHLDVTPPDTTSGTPSFITVGNSTAGGLHFFAPVLHTQSSLNIQNVTIVGNSQMCGGTLNHRSAICIDDPFVGAHAIVSLNTVVSRMGDFLVWSSNQPTSDHGALFNSHLQLRDVVFPAAQTGVRFGQASIVPRHVLVEDSDMPKLDVLVGRSMNLTVRNTTVGTRFAVACSTFVDAGCAAVMVDARGLTATTSLAIVADNLNFSAVVEGGDDSVESSGGGFFRIVGSAAAEGDAQRADHAVMAVVGLSLYQIAVSGHAPRRVSREIQHSSLLLQSRFASSAQLRLESSADVATDSGGPLTAIVERNTGTGFAKLYVEANRPALGNAANALAVDNQLSAVQIQGTISGSALVHVARNELKFAAASCQGSTGICFFQFYGTDGARVLIENTTSTGDFWWFTASLHDSLLQLSNVTLKSKLNIVSNFAFLANSTFRVDRESSIVIDLAHVRCVDRATVILTPDTHLHSLQLEADNGPHGDVDVRIASILQAGSVVYLQKTRFNPRVRVAIGPSAVDGGDQLYPWGGFTARDTAVHVRLNPIYMYAADFMTDEGVPTDVTPRIIMRGLHGGASSLITYTSRLDNVVLDIADNTEFTTLMFMSCVLTYATMVVESTTLTSGDACGGVPSSVCFRMTSVTHGVLCISNSTTGKGVTFRTFVDVSIVIGNGSAIKELRSHVGVIENSSVVVHPGAAVDGVNLQARGRFQFAMLRGATSTGKLRITGAVIEPCRSCNFTVWASAVVNQQIELEHWHFVDNPSGPSSRAMILPDAAEDALRYAADVASVASDGGFFAGGGSNLNVLLLKFIHVEHRRIVVRDLTIAYLTFGPLEATNAVVDFTNVVTLTQFGYDIQHGSQVGFALRDSIFRVSRCEGLGAALHKAILSNTTVVFRDLHLLKGQRGGVFCGLGSLAAGPYRNVCILDSDISDGSLVIFDNVSKAQESTLVQGDSTCDNTSAVVFTMQRVYAGQDAAALPDTDTTWAIAATNLHLSHSAVLALDDIRTHSLTVAMTSPGVVRLIGAASNLTQFVGTCNADASALRVVNDAPDPGTYTQLGTGSCALDTVEASTVDAPFVSRASWTQRVSSVDSQLDALQDASSEQQSVASAWVDSISALSNRGCAALIPPVVTTTAAPTTTTTAASTTTAATTTTAGPTQPVTVAETNVTTTEPQQTTSIAPTPTPPPPRSSTPTVEASARPDDPPANQTASRALTPTRTATAAVPLLSATVPNGDGDGEGGNVDGTKKALETLVGDPETAEGVRATVTASVALTAVAVDPTAASRIVRLTTTSAVVECAFDEDDVEPSPFELPFQFDLGSGTFKRFAGALLLTTAATLVVPSIILVYLYSSARRLVTGAPGSSDASATATSGDDSAATPLGTMRGRIRFAGHLLAALSSYFSPSITQAGVTVLVYGTTPLHKFVAAVTVLIAVLVPTATLYALVKIQPGQMAFVREPPEKHFATVVASDPTSFVVDLLGPAMEPCRDPSLLPHRAALAEEVLVAVVLAALAGIRPTQEMYCRIVGVVGFVIALLHLVFLVWQQPLARRIDTAYALFNAATLAAVSAIGGASTMSSSLVDAYYWAVGITLLSFYAQALTALAWYGYLTYKRRSQRRRSDRSGGSNKKQYGTEMVSDPLLQVPTPDDNSSGGGGGGGAASRSEAPRANPLEVASPKKP